jgi:CRISPR/Cas system CSM-associated protein Csm3 (group 7 of RAMP superfamily)
MGEILFDHLRLSSTPQTSKANLPYFMSWRQSFIAHRVAVDRTTGTAEDQKLFATEMVPAGSLFEGQIVINRPKDDAIIMAEAVLQPLLTEEGLQVGKGGTYGFGRIVLEKQRVTARETRLYASPKWKTEDDAEETQHIFASVSDLSETTQLKLISDGPFFVVDPSRADRAEANASNEDRSATSQIQAARRSDDQPWLPETSLYGALRSRAAWIAASRPAYAGRTSDEVDDRNKTPDTWSSLDELTPVERLFGVTGWRGLLSITHLSAFGKSKLVEFDHVSIDRFTGGALDQALYSVKAFDRASFQVSLTLDAKRLSGNSQDEQLFNDLLNDLQQRGLELGHAARTGYGWFTVTSEGEEEHA